MAEYTTVETKQKVNRIKQILKKLVKKSKDKKIIKILVIDDEAITTDLIAHVLKESDNIKILKAIAFNQALEIIKKEKLDIVFLDLLLGDKDGKGLIKWIKKTNPQTRILVITAYKERTQEMLAAGVSKVYLKPLAIEEIKKELPALIAKMRS